MTHTLHRLGKSEDLKEDYVLLVMQARGVNREGNEEKMGQVWEVLSHYEADFTNFGNMTDGNSHTTTMEILKKTTWHMAHAVFKDRESLRACLQELKERDLGISTVVSGLYEEAEKTCREIGLSPHTVEHSLGIFGRTDLLPEENVLEITTMCGHALVSPHLVKDLIDGISNGRTTYKEAAQELSRVCDCGIFNIYRAEKVLKKIISDGGN